MSSKVKNLKRMKARLAGEIDSSVEVPFELTCECGEIIRGVRRDRGIQKQCDQCGEFLYVLPMNVYPATKSVDSEVIGGGIKNRLKVVLSEILPARQKAKPATDVATDTDANGVAADTQTDSEEVVAPRRRLKLPTLPRINIRQLIRRTFTPFRLLIAAILIVVGLTGFWLTQQKAEEAARQVWLNSTDTIQSLLDDGEFVDLEAQLRETVAAGRTLQKQDSEWRLTLNLYQETQAVNNLAGTDLLSAFHAAYDDSGAIVDNAVSAINNAADSGTFVFESTLKPDPQNEGACLFEIPAAPGMQFVTGAIRLPELQQFLEAVPDGRALFSANIETIVAPDQQQQLTWRIELEPSSFVLLTSAQICNNLGLSSEYDPDVQVLLDRQKDFVKESDRWENRATDSADDNQTENLIQQESL